MKTILKNSSQIVTVNTNGDNYKRGSKANDLNVLTDHALILENGIIQDIIPNNSVKVNPNDIVLDLWDKVILPGFNECHTHTVFAGSRGNEFRLKLKGATYEEIALNGGGILSTVKSVRQTSFEELVKITIPKVYNFITQGVTTLEIKSGYGLDFENEVKILRVINQLKNIFKIEIIPTFLGAHTFPPEYKDNRPGYISLITEDMLPFISDQKLAEFCDVFTEQSAFTADETDLIFKKADKCGLKIKIHTEQFHSIGGIETALKHRAVSVEHLEVLIDEHIESIADTETVAVLLPGVSFFLKYGYAPARQLLKNNAIVALATDYNPGSSNINSLSIIMGLAALNMKMTIEEIISAYTINSAKALDRHKTTGSIELGKKADLAVLNTNDYSDLVYKIGENLNILTIKNGEIIYDKTGEYK